MSDTDTNGRADKNAIESVNTPFDMQKAFRMLKESRDYESLIAQVPYASLIGMKIVPMGDELVYALPGLESNIGNMLVPAIHGGCIGGFLESAATFEIMLTQDVDHLPKIVDLSIDYLRTGRKQDTFAQCNIVRQGRKIINISVVAWQSTKDDPIATARAHYLLRD